MSRNALDAVTLTTGRHTLVGWSIAGIATYLQVPDLDLCFDMGECPLSAVPLNHVFLTHAHGDHSRCVLRHHALRNMMGIERPATYYMPAEIVEGFKGTVIAEARFEGGEPEMPHVIGLQGDRALVPFTHRRGLFVSAFEVKHRAPSLGYTIVERRQKLKKALEGVAGHELAAMKQRGEEVTDAHDAPLITFIGDCIGDSLLEQAHIWESPVVVIEASFLALGDEQRAKDVGHTHVREVMHALETLQPKTEHIVLKHFSLKHKPDDVVGLIDAAISPSWRSRVKLLL